MTMMLPCCKSAVIPTHFVALGANLPALDGAPPRLTCERAAQAIASLPYVVSATKSRWYSSAPLPPSGQPRYINGIIKVKGKVSPSALLADLQEMELKAGRIRGEANAPRVLDIDIVDMDGVIRSAPDPVLPHPRAHQRAFVLLPLRDVAPRWIEPISGQSVQQLLRGLPRQDIFAI